ncbi:Glycoside hydrolase family 79 protein [Mycena indigotica]|uniref:Glycoside hydrolase family 79 protein n=1 Tax=Mycena indigotica TaxID=2126181 RepID=A0A8H6T8K6_9AGAR|nr:Glycoside hydrolase family 79 protein [Mycena indigotica]KAF7312337.1 Glycoside hydrolase family 79 protein [Mycena indigotica]
MSFKPLLCILSTSLATFASTLTLPGPAALPSDASSPLSPALASFSIETAFFIEYIGNTTDPNTLSQHLLQNLKDRTGTPAEVRIGGITADSTYWDPSLNTAIFNFIDSSGTLFNSTIGPEFWEAARSLLPKDTKVTVNLDLHNFNYTGALAVAQSAISGLDAGQLIAFEIGNEPDHYSPSLSAAKYDATWVPWSKNITEALGFSEPMFQIAATAEDPLWPYTASGASSQLDCVSALAAGASSAGTVKSCSEHTYQYSVCDPTRTAVATLPNLVSPHSRFLRSTKFIKVNHTRLAMYLDLWQPRIQSVRAQLGPDSFVIGEYNSVSCSGKAGVSDTFGQALWLLDTTLYAASINVSRLYIHQGGPLALQSSTQLNHGGLSRYDLWSNTEYPMDALNGEKQVFPSYSAYLFITEAIGHSNSLRIANLWPGRQTNGSSITTAGGDFTAGQNVVYGFWEDDAQDFPTKIALLNLQIFNQTELGPRPSTTFDLSAFLRPKQKYVRVRRLQAAGADVTFGNATFWSGQTFAVDSDGLAQGQLYEDVVKGGEIQVEASSAALVFL